MEMTMKGELYLRSGPMSFRMQIEPSQYLRHVEVIATDTFSLIDSSDGSTKYPAATYTLDRATGLMDEWNFDDVQIRLAPPFMLRCDCMSFMVKKREEDKFTFQLETTRPIVAAGSNDDPALLEPGSYLIQRKKTENTEWLIQTEGHKDIEVGSQVTVLPRASFELRLGSVWMNASANVVDLSALRASALVCRTDEKGADENTWIPVKYLQSAPEFAAVSVQAEQLDPAIERIKAQILSISNIATDEKQGRLETEKSSGKTTVYLISELDKTIEWASGHTTLAAFKALREKIVYKRAGDSSFVAGVIAKLLDNTCELGVSDGR